MGTDREHEVYEAEVIGLLMGLELLARERDVREAAVYIDNQAVIRTLQGGTTSNLGFFYEQLDEAVRRVREGNAGIRMDTRWILGHAEVEGNKRADEAAKQAANRTNLTNSLLPNSLKRKIPVNPVAAKRTRRAGMDEEWKGWVKDEGSEARTTKFTNDIDDKYPSMQYYKGATNLTPFQFAMLTQLRTGHYPTASYLFRFNLNDSPRCQHCDTHTETVAHLFRGAGPWTD